MRPRKRFGQHFLEPVWVAKLLTAIAPAPEDRFLEIGPGRGVITIPLAAQVSSILAVEVDRGLAAALDRQRLPNVSVVAADVLTVDLEELAAGVLNATPQSRVRVVGNLPYNISSPILFRLLTASRGGRFQDATLMLQKEVADRLVAVPDTSDYGVLTMTTALWADVTRLLALPPGAFRPAPRVHSAVVRLIFRPPPGEILHPDAVVELVRAVFTQRRKTLANALAPLAASRGAAAKDVLARADIDSRRRPETLTIGEAAQLAEALG